VDNDEHVDSIGLYPVDDPVGLLDDLTDVFGVILRNLAAREGLIGNLLMAMYSKILTRWLITFLVQ
jgi:hypothetical protein